MQSTDNVIFLAPGIYKANGQHSGVNMKSVIYHLCDQCKQKQRIHQNLKSTKKKLHKIKISRCESQLIDEKNIRTLKYRTRANKYIQLCVLSLNTNIFDFC